MKVKPREYIIIFFISVAIVFSALGVGYVIHEISEHVEIRWVDTPVVSSAK